MKKVDKSGFWLVENNPITKEGVFPYLGKQIDPDGKIGLDPNKIYNTFRSIEEIANEETLKSFNGVPFIDEHEMLGEGFTSTDKRPAGGVIFNVRRDEANKMVIADFKIYSDKMKSEIRNGKKELSLGYFCSYKQKMGVYDGIPYDFIQCDIRGNHVALVSRGRMGPDVRVYDKANCFDSMEINMKDKKTAIDEIVKKLDTVSDEILGKVKDVLDGCGGSEEPKPPSKDNEKKPEEARPAEAKPEDKKPEEKADSAKNDKKAGEKATDKPEDKPAEAKPKEKKAEDTFKEVAAKIAARDSLFEDVKPLVGSFDHALMNEAEVAHYACDKLGITDCAGNEVAAVKGYLAGHKNDKKFSIDQSVNSTQSFDEFKKQYLAKK